MGRHDLVFLTLLVAFMSTGCSKALKPGLEDDQFFFERGKKYLEKKDSLKAIADFQTIVESYQSSTLIDQAQYMLAEAHFKNEDYITAAYEYERLFMDYPSSKLVPEASFKRALCYYHESPKADLDQENTRIAIDDFNRFIDNFPRHPLAAEAQKYIEELTAKLAFKSYKAAELYRKLKKYEAALMYYRLVIKDYPRNIWADEARYGMGLIYLKQKKYEQAKEVFQLLVNTDVSKDLKKNASRKLPYIENKTRPKK